VEVTAQSQRTEKAVAQAVKTFNEMSNKTSSALAHPAFFAIVVLALLAWLPTVVLMDTGVSDLIVDSITNPLQLLLLVLLHNNQYRVSKASDDRGDQTAWALASLLDHAADTSDDEDRSQRLRKEAAELRRDAEKDSDLSAGNTPRKE
jgi:low affinity Fe/Cu permease